MLTKLRALLYIITHVGRAARVMGDVSTLGRYWVLESMREIGLFDYLREPHTFKEIMNEFGFINSDYTADVMVALTNDREGVLEFDGERYFLHPQHRLPTYDEMKARLSPAVLGLHIAGELAKQVPLRMRGESSAFAQRLERERGELMTFDSTLSNRIYDTLRVSSWIWARPYIGSLDGKTLLDVGCGSGRETAHLWLLLDGKVKITAVDPVPSFVDMARERFSAMLQGLNRGKPHPPLTDDNRPEFQVMSAVNLNYPDAHFDLVFHAGMLHWTSNPQKAVAEMLRVLKPGGVIFGGVTYKPAINTYQDLLIRVSDNVAGFPWHDDIVRWHRDNGVEFENLVSGVYRAKKKA